MIAYKASDIKYSWDGQVSDGLAPRTCGYVKEGKGNLFNQFKT